MASEDRFLRLGIDLVFCDNDVIIGTIQLETYELFQLLLLFKN